jgi:hypothetical protein
MFPLLVRFVSGNKIVFFFGHFPVVRDVTPNYNIVLMGNTDSLYELSSGMQPFVRGGTACIWNKEKSPEQWKGSLVALTHKEGDKTDCINYRGISLLWTIYKILSCILQSRLPVYIDTIILDHQCGFRRNR